MKRTLLALLAGALALATQAGAASSRHIVLQIGDTFFVAGTHIACNAQFGQPVAGQRAVACFEVKGGRLPPSSYVAGLAANGRTVVGKVDAKGNIGSAVFDRKPASLRSSAKQYTAKVGDQLLVAGTTVICVINHDASGTYPTCFRETRKGPAVPGSYAIAETDAFVAVVQFDSAGKTTKLVFKRIQG